MNGSDALAVISFKPYLNSKKFYAENTKREGELGHLL
jgi:hypothetical protein